ncbi:hypothetical protein BDB01DRAFT_358246 [Pilobolus umbonatus]|nr:hypothetical protein BDB01DRAFT_358246 [Pilobolus umbonatus]
MEDSIQPMLTWWNVAGASVFVVIAAGVSVMFGMKLELSLIVSAIRCVVQLSLMGLVLTDVLATEHMSLVILLSGTFLLQTIIKIGLHIYFSCYYSGIGLTGHL